MWRHETGSDRFDAMAKHCVLVGKTADDFGAFYKVSDVHNKGRTYIVRITVVGKLHVKIEHTRDTLRVVQARSPDLEDVLCIVVGWPSFFDNIVRSTKDEKQTR